MKSLHQHCLATQTPIDQIFRECFPKKISREERRYTALLRDPYESGAIDSDKVIRLCELIKQMSVEWTKETKQAERVKIRFLRALNLPIDTIGEWEVAPTPVVPETVEGVREKTEQALTTPHLEEERTNIITRAMINTIHLNAASVIKLNEKWLSPGERKFLIQISEWNLIGKVIGDKALEIIRKRVMEYIGDFPQENIDSIKREYKGMTADSLCSVAKRKKMSFDFHSFSPEAIEVLSPEVREFIFKISRSRKWFLGKTFNPEMITEEQDRALQIKYPVKKRIFPHLRKFST